MRPGPILLDTGPLLTYLTLLYADSINAPKLYRDTLFRDIRRHATPFGEKEQERFGELIEVRRAPVTPHVILEATRMREHSELARVGRFVEFSIEVLFGGTISEISCSLGDICKEPEYIALVHRFGVTDAGLLFVSAREECLLLTDDHDLFAAYEADSKFQIRLLDEFLASTD
jgi:hypothetical protein